MEPSALNVLTKESALSLAEQQLFYKDTIGDHNVISYPFLLEEDRHAILNIEVPSLLDETEGKKKKKKGKKTKKTWLTEF
jgi:hypothetical protein